MRGAYDGRVAYKFGGGVYNPSPQGQLVLRHRFTGKARAKLVSYQSGCTEGGITFSRPKLKQIFDPSEVDRWFKPAILARANFLLRGGEGKTRVSKREGGKG